MLPVVDSIPGKLCLRDAAKKMSMYLYSTMIKWIVYDYSGTLPYLILNHQVCHCCD